MDINFLVSLEHPQADDKCFCSPPPSATPNVSTARRETASSLPSPISLHSFPSVTSVDTQLSLSPPPISPPQLPVAYYGAAGFCSPPATPASVGSSRSPESPFRLPPPVGTPVRPSAHSIYSTPAYARSVQDLGVAPPTPAMSPVMSSAESEADRSVREPSEQPPASGPAKPKRRRATPQQLLVLNQVFKQTFFPSTDLRLRLARQLNMTPRAVQIWFQNKRQGWRTRHGTSSYPPRNATTNLQQLQGLLGDDLDDDEDVDPNPKESKKQCKENDITTTTAASFSQLAVSTPQRTHISPVSLPHPPTAPAAEMQTPQAPAYTQPYTHPYPYPLPSMPASPLPPHYHLTPTHAYSPPSPPAPTVLPAPPPFAPASCPANFYTNPAAWQRRSPSPCCSECSQCGVSPGSGYEEERRGSWA
ncbi:hypothetical protein HDV00_001021 [Rhizophlyctis rosea]|nr:hypothetical protein HDV00_001021 [Rhizophlyctis rosea]